ARLVAVTPAALVMPVVARLDLECPQQRQDRDQYGHLQKSTSFSRRHGSSLGLSPPDASCGLVRHAQASTPRSGSESWRKSGGFQGILRRRVERGWKRARGLRAGLVLLLVARLGAVMMAEVAARAIDGYPLLTVASRPDTGTGAPEHPA